MHPENSLQSQLISIFSQSVPKKSEFRGIHKSETTRYVYTARWSW